MTTNIDNGKYIPKLKVIVKNMPKNLMKFYKFIHVEIKFK